MKYIKAFESVTPNVNIYTIKFGNYFFTENDHLDWAALTEYIDNLPQSYDEYRDYDIIYQFIVDKFGLSELFKENKLVRLMAAYIYTYRDVSLVYDEELGQIEDFWIRNSEVYKQYKTQNPDSDLMKQIEKIKKFQRFDL